MTRILRGTISSKGPAVVLGFAIQSGLPSDVLLRAAGLSPAVLADPDAYVTPEEDQRAWDEAARLTGDEALGVHVAEWVALAPAEYHDTMSYAFRSCPTLGESYERWRRYIGVFHRRAYIALETEEGVARLVHGVSDHPKKPARQQTEFLLASLVLMARQIADESFAPLAVHFMHSRPARVSEQERVFRAPVRYGSLRNEISLDSAWLSRPLPQGDPKLLSVLERQLEEQLSQLPQESRFLPAVRLRIRRMLPEGEPSILSVAEKLRMSPRTLQRRLADSGTSFSRVLEAERRDLALRYLEDPRTAISEVAFLLGFSTVQAFHRAFKRWTGLTPMELRKQHASRSSR